MRRSTRSRRPGASCRRAPSPGPRHRGPGSRAPIAPRTDRSGRRPPPARSSNRTPSEVVAPTCRPAVRQDVADHPRGRGLAVGAADADDGHPAVGVPDPGRRVRPGVTDRPQRPGERPRSPGSARGASGRGPRRAWIEVQVHQPERGLGDGLGAAILAPRVRHDPDTRLGRAMDAHRDAGTAGGRGAAFGRRATRPRPTDGGASRSTPRGRPRNGAPRARGTGAPSRTRACMPGSRWPNHVRRRPTPTSTLTVGSRRYTLGPSRSRISTSRTAARIACPDPLPTRLGAMDQLVTPTELDRLSALMTAGLPAYLADLRAPRRHRLRLVHQGRRGRGRPMGRGHFRDLGADVEVLPNEAYGDTVVGTFGGAERPVRHCCWWVTWTRCSIRARSPSGRSPSGTASRWGRASRT